jgi:hypothetical protein
MSVLDAAANFITTVMLPGIVGVSVTAILVAACFRFIARMTARGT